MDIVIDSRGGDFEQSIALYRAIRWAPALTRRVRMLRHCSSGAIVAMAGDVRIARHDTEVVALRHRTACR
ncbi:ATP-dependent Clp protease proteolytic subunit [Chelativorans sp. M5D2P16]|uniref:ATP-dependent Clp protease proteolytic subunit n=1 Tax=Chelativorans sp. M5D2P16 TaxID=3095678 RepID=UPI003A0FF4CD